MITYVIILILGMFLGFLAFAPKRICTLCASITLTWFMLLGLFWLGKEIDPTIIAILMGSSATGAMYWLGPRLGQFKLPFLITCFWLIFVVLGNFSRDVALAGGIIVVVWVLFALTTTPKFQRIGKRLVACCRDW